MTWNTTDILISGAGIAGMVAAALLARQGRRVTLVDPMPPVAAAGDAGSDLRSTAFLQPSRKLFEEAGLWDALDAYATPLDKLRVMDTSGWPPVIRDTRTFVPDDLGHDTFGWNLPNWLTRRELARVLEETPGVDLRLGTGFRAMLTRDREAIVTLSDRSQVSARLVIGADGRASPVADAAGIGMRTTRYGQKALAFAVTHALPHDNVSTEVYNRGGATTTVPLPDQDGRAASAIVWMEDGPRAVQLSHMVPEDLADELDMRICHVLGPSRLATPVRVWPVVTQTAERLTARRTALVAEAAHVLPPIGAQGLNTSLADVADLAHRVAEAEDPGAEALLDGYAASRARDIRARAKVVDLFNRVCRSDIPAVQAMRLAGLKAVHGLTPVRRTVMRAGLGSEGDRQNT